MGKTTSSCDLSQGLQPKKTPPLAPPLWAAGMGVRVVTGGEESSARSPAPLPQRSARPATQTSAIFRGAGAQAKLSVPCSHVECGRLGEQVACGGPSQGNGVSTRTTPLLRALIGWEPSSHESLSPSLPDIPTWEAQGRCSLVDLSVSIDWAGHSGMATGWPQF